MKSRCRLFGCRAGRIIGVLAALCLYSFAGYSAAEAAEAGNDITAAVVVSMNIRPYLEAVEGFREFLSARSISEIKIIQIDKYPAPEDRDKLAGELEAGHFSVLVAIGPAAARFLWEDLPSRTGPRIFSMVLNPETIFTEGEKACGIPLNIPVRTQLKVIQGGLPSIRKLGLLYDPAFNSYFFNEARTEGIALGLEVIPLAVSSKGFITDALQRGWESIDALWLIPDRTIGSESIIQFVIREALFRKIPVLGYNRFFYESGAALSFIFDYVELGRQCGQKAVELATGMPCIETEPRFEAWVNRRVLERIGMPLSDVYMSPLKVGP